MSERLDEAGLKAATEAVEARYRARSGMDRDTVVDLGFSTTADIETAITAYLSALPVDEGAVERAIERYEPRAWSAMIAARDSKDSWTRGRAIDWLADRRFAMRAVLSAALSTDHSPPEGEG